MQFKHHILIGLISSTVLVYFFNFSYISAIIIFLASVLIDLDHYFWYSVTRKDWNPINALKWYNKAHPKWARMTPGEKSKFRNGVFIFHGICFWTILAILSIFNEIFLWILIGIAIHIIPDLLNLKHHKEPLYIKLCPAYVIRTNKNKKPLSEI